MPNRSLRPARTRRTAQTRGAVMVEYALLLVAVGVPTITGLVKGGQLVFQDYVQTRDSVMQATP